MPSKVENNHPPLENVTKPSVDTAAAAYYLNRQPQTLRAWAAKQNGPLRALNINGRLAWPVCAIRSLCGLGSESSESFNGQ